MKAIETIANINKKGQLILNTPLNLKNKEVRVIILVPEDNNISDQDWLSGLSSNPAFDYLKDRKEDIYTLHDGSNFCFDN